MWTVWTEFCSSTSETQLPVFQEKRQRHRHTDINTYNYWLQCCSFSNCILWICGCSNYHLSLFDYFCISSDIMAVWLVVWLKFFKTTCESIPLKPLCVKSIIDVILMYQPKPWLKCNCKYWMLIYIFYLTFQSCIRPENNKKKYSTTSINVFFFSRVIQYYFAVWVIENIKKNISFSILLFSLCV